VDRFVMHAPVETLPPGPLPERNRGEQTLETGRMVPAFVARGQQALSRGWPEVEIGLRPADVICGV
jgi:hypothetical protein